MPGHGSQTLVDRRDNIMLHSTQMSVSVSSHLKRGQVNRLLPLRLCLVVRNREAISTKASASLRWKQNSTSYIEHGAGLLEADSYHIDSLNSGCEQFANPRGMVSDNGCLKL